MPITKNNNATNKLSTRSKRAKSNPKKSGKNHRNIQFPRWFSSRLPLIITIIGFTVFGTLFIIYSSAATTIIEKAQKKPAIASSLESSNYVATKANDGSESTRWASRQGLNNQWWQVDLGSITPVSRVDIKWETAYASRYYIQGSTDGTTFKTLADVSISQAGWKSTSFAEKSIRYVRIYGLTRGTKWGFSIWETRVFGSVPATPTPAPAPTTTPQKPDASNTGVPTGITLRSITAAYPDAAAKGYTVNAQGRVTITKDGGVYENLLLPDGVWIKAKNVTIKNSRIVAGRSSFTRMPPEPTSWDSCRSIRQAVEAGTYPTSSTVVVDANHSNVSNLVLEDSEIAVDEYSIYIAGYMGHDTTMRRVDISGGVDGIGTHNGYASTANFRLENSWIHDLYRGQWSVGNKNKNPVTGQYVYCGYDAAHPEATHNDAIQMHDGSNVTILKNTINPKPVNHTQANAGIMMNGAGNVVIDGNHFQYGVCSINMVPGLILPITVSNNTFYGNNGSGGTAGQNDNGCSIIRPATAGYIFTNNLWQIGTPIKLING